MAVEVILAPLARKDLGEIFDYIAEQDQVIAIDVITRLQHAIMLLGERPFMGSPVALPARRGLRKFSVRPHIIFYRVLEAELQIVRVLHGSRDLTDETLYTARLE